jgi:hypothetical protein
MGFVQTYKNGGPSATEKLSNFNEMMQSINTFLAIVMTIFG